MPPPKLGMIRQVATARELVIQAPKRWWMGEPAGLPNVDMAGCLT
ncbi:hypothetical protein HMPREF9153_1043 [Cutibacterium avidum ATCC 25577]|uniref:Uncharacterized protein n=1 Tax=Cutibacterium avidum ATCC 25577 TaxID=997355 RepID=G4CWY6_9ACTN|nr:hypothetical protein HMPREF9153_1043 [Cutibacterium avidum ATCC 25577]